MNTDSEALNAVKSPFPQSEDSKTKTEREFRPDAATSQGVGKAEVDSGKPQDVRSRGMSSPVKRVQEAFGISHLKDDIPCPAHDDNTPSLSVDEGSDGIVLLKCHAGCDTEDILDAVGLVWKDLYPDDTDWDIFDDCAEETERYAYVGADDEVLFDVVRFEVTDRNHPAYGEKDFRQQAYLPENPKARQSSCPEGYVWGRKKYGVSPTLYRLPRVKEAIRDGRPIFLVEGEKDVHTLEECGFVATTSPQGAGKWNKRFSEQLQGADVYILPDNDDPGKDHAETVANSLDQIARSVYVLQLPDLPRKGDVTDWLERGHDTEELRALMEEANEWVPEGQEQLALDTDEGAPDLDIFWRIEKGKVKIDRSSLLRFLRLNGFGKLYGESDLNSMLVRVGNQVVGRTSIERVKDFVFDYIRDLPSERGLPFETDGKVRFDEDYDARDVEDALLRGANIYFSKSLFDFLRPLDLDFHRDTADTAFFYYENGFVEVTEEGYRLRPYDELDGVIWEEQITTREFVELDVEAERPTGDWDQFLRNVSGRDPSRQDALLTSIGYLLHGYKDPARAKAIVFVDEEISDVPSGRSGKSLVGEAVSHVVPAVRVDAKNFSFDSRFRFQEVELDTQIVDFNDAPKRFVFERLFSAITDAMQREKKGMDSVTIPFEDSPKFLVSTNYVIEGYGPSFEDRIFEVEFHPHYDTSHRPMDDFDRRFFEEWDEDEWNRFDNIMMYCVSLYLERGLVDYRHVNLKERRLGQETSPDFAVWIMDKKPGWYNKKDLFNSFKDSFKGEYDELTQRQFTRWCNKYGRIFTRDDLPTKKSGAKRSIKLPAVQNE